MKKLLGVLLVATTLVASTFALDLSIGGRGLIGGNIGNAKTEGEGFVVGGGAFVNLGLIGGFGVQAEANFLSSKVKIVEEGTQNVASFEQCNVVDFPVMAWYNFNLGKLAIGGGLGVNFSTYLDNAKLKATNTDGMNIGMAVGANFKFYFNDHFGLVLGANGVFDFNATTVKEGSTKKVYFGGNDDTRKSLYGTVGAEFKLF